jgi:hypothetical protein
MINNISSSRVSNNNKTTSNNVFLLECDTIIPYNFSNSTTKISSKQLVIVAIANDDTFQYLEKYQSILKCIIPAPWLNSKQKKRIMNFASKWAIEFYDPEKSGWRSFSI